MVTHLRMQAHQKIHFHCLYGNLKMVLACPRPNRVVQMHQISLHLAQLQQGQTVLARPGPNRVMQMHQTSLHRAQLCQQGQIPKQDWSDN
jgi:hypothetical protein